MLARLALVALCALAWLAPVAAQAADPVKDIDPKELEQEAAQWDAAQAEQEVEAYRDLIEAEKEKIVALDAQIAGAAEGADTSAQAAELQEARERRDALAGLMQVGVDRLRELDVDVARHQLYLTETTGRLQAGNLSAGMLAELANTWYERGRDWLIDEGPSLIFSLIAFLLILLVFRFIGSLLAKVVDRALRASKLQTSALLRNFFKMIITKGALLVGLVIALGQVGVEIGPLLAGIGVIGFIVGFALQETLANFAAGVMILLYRPYDVGDYITAAGESGSVDSMSLVSTTIRTPDNQVLVVPNGSIWGGVIRNVTAQATRRVDLTFGIGYGDDIEKAEKVFMDVVTAHPKVLKDPAPLVKLGSLGDSSVNFLVRPWCKTSDYWDVLWDLHRAVKLRLDAEGISIPFPQRDVHLFHENAPKEPAAV